MAKVTWLLLGSLCGALACGGSLVGSSSGTGPSASTGALGESVTTGAVTGASTTGRETTTSSGPSSSTSGSSTSTSGSTSGLGSTGASTGRSASGSSSNSGSTSGGTSVGTGYVIDGGALASLDFGLVGDTRPPIYDDTPNYPTNIITTIFQDLAALSPPVAFVASTGDYMFASPFLGQAGPQAMLYVGAATAPNYTGPVYPAMGNHECDFSTSSANCFGQTSNPNYNAYLQEILGGLKLPTTSPYFAVTYYSAVASNPWTAKFIYTAPNAWDDGQNAWIAQLLAQPTTYTFLVRHEPTTNSGSAPGVAPTDLLLTTNPFTLKLTGHSHSFSYDTGNREMINGLGGASLDTGYTGTFGYVVCRQRADLAIQCSQYDYDTNQISTQQNSTFAIQPDGTPTATQ